MKKVFLLCACIVFAMMAKGQSAIYHKFKFDIGFGYAIPQTGEGTKAGATVTLQPHVRLSDNFAIGIRAEVAALGYKTGTDDDSDVDVHALQSYCFTGEIYLAKSGFRPFIGGGLGFFKQSIVNDNDDTGGVTLTPVGTKFGFFPELGFEAGHFRMSADYSVVGNNNNYASFKIGFFFGGGKK